jgi:tetratricopeptide (TPR) repeat protein
VVERRLVMDMQELLRDAQLLFANGKDKESLEAFTKALEAGADPYLVYLSRGVVYVRTREADSALENFSKAIEANSKSARAHFYRGIAFMMKEEFENAIADFTKALELKTDYAMALFARAVSYARLGKFDESSKDMLVVVPQMEQSVQSFADSYGIVRTQMWKAMAQMGGGEAGTPTLSLKEKDMETLKKWLKAE